MPARQAQGGRGETEGGQLITIDYRRQAGIAPTGAAVSRLASMRWHNETKGAAK